MDLVDQLEFFRLAMNKWTLLGGLNFYISGDISVECFIAYIFLSEVLWPYLYLESRNNNADYSFVRFTPGLTAPNSILCILLLHHLQPVHVVRLG